MAAPAYPTGRCALGTKCQFEQMELRPAHTCTKCGKVLHVLCAVLNEDDTIHCKVDCTIEQISKNLKNSSSKKCIPVPPTKVSAPKKIAMYCKLCGGTDHSRRSSKKCKFYKNPSSTPSNVPSKLSNRHMANINDSGPQCRFDSTHAVEHEVKLVLNEIVNKVALINSHDVFVTHLDKDDDDDDVADDRLSKPRFIPVGDEDADLRNYVPVVDVSKSNFKFTDTVFKINKIDYRNRSTTVTPNPVVLMQKYFPLTLIQRIVNHSNSYVEECKRRYPHLTMWKRNTDSRPFTPSSVYQFLAILYYQGLVRLPSKDDYWSCDPIMPTHDLCIQLGMTRNRFRFLWRYFHCNHPNEDDFENNDDAAEEDDTFVAQTMERVQVDQEEEEEDTCADGGAQEEVDERKSRKVSLWFNKLEPIINHFRQVSEDLIFTLGTKLSLDEMMIRFSGRSKETHRIKNKPIGEGFKFFVLTTSHGFVVNFTPDGRSAAKNNEQEYQDDKALGKIDNMIMHLLSVIDRLKEKQQKRIKKKYTKISTRTNDVQSFESEPSQQEFVIAMDNYFTLPKVIKKLRDKKIGVIGTARFRKNWPPTSLKNVSADKVDFNDFNWTVDENGTLVGRWMDNGLVLVVSTVHKIKKIVKRMRKKPRKTPKNKNHVDKIWGDKGAVFIFIPTMIDDYNHWMGGVDLTDQMIAYYHPDLRCLRNWVPMFIQVLSLIRTNSYHVYKKETVGEILSHKQFTLEMIKYLMSEALKHYLDESKKEVLKSTPTYQNSTISIAAMSTGASSAVSSITNPDDYFTSATAKGSARKTESTILRRSTRAVLQSSTSVHSISSRSKRQLPLIDPSQLPPRPTKIQKLNRKSSTIEEFDFIRFQPPRSSHIRVSNFLKDDGSSDGKSKKSNKSRKRMNNNRRERCFYCSCLFDKLKGDDGCVIVADGRKRNWDSFVKRTVYKCSLCDVHLCDKHFDTFHTNNENDGGTV